MLLKLLLLYLLLMRNEVLHYMSFFMNFQLIIKED